MIESGIITSVFSEEMFDKVKFLEPSDFENETNQQLWRFICESNGDVIKMISRMTRLERARYTNAMTRACLGYYTHKAPQMGLKLVERKFRSLFIKLIEELIGRSENKVEKLLLAEMIQAVIDEDIFVLTDHAKDYVGQHASTFTKSRFDDFLKYRNKRIEKIKTLINGNQ